MYTSASGYKKMSWLVWALAGAGIGWWGNTLTAAPGEELRKAPAKLPASAGSAALIALVLLAAAHNFDWLPTFIYGIEGFLLSPRMIAIAFGLASGFLARRYSNEIAERASEFYKALLGNTKSSWVLQSSVGLLALFGIVMALNPGMLEHLETLRAGELEAKFASVSATTREAVRINLSDFVTNAEFSFDDWINFSTKFLRYRDAASEKLDDQQDAREDRIRIRNAILKYVEPLAIIVNCFEKNDRIDSLRKNEPFVRLTINLRNKMLAENGTGLSFIGNDSMGRLLNELVTAARGLLNNEILSVRDRDRCQEITELDQKIAAVRTYDGLEKEYSGLSSVKAKLNGEDSKFNLWFIDPYIPEFVGELIALTLGYNEKAKFMMRIKDKYPTPDNSKFVRPGMINLYYQLVTAKSRSEATWPFAEGLRELDAANAGVDFILRESKNRSRFEPEIGNEIAKEYYQARFMNIKRYIDLYYQRALSGTPISSQDRSRWIMFFRQAEAIMNLRYIGATTLSLAESEGAALSRDEMSEWSKVDIKPGRRFNAEVGLTLSAVLLTERRGSAPVQACTIARFHLERARDILPRAADEDKMDSAVRTRVSGFLEQVRARIDVSC